MFSGTSFPFFILQHFQRPDDLRAGFLRADQTVQLSLRCCVIRGRELFLVFLYFFLPYSLFIFGRVNFFAVEDAHRPLGAHDGNLRGGPSQNDIRAHFPAVHRGIRASVGFADYARDLGDRGLFPGIEHLGPMADDPFMLLFDSRKIPGDIDERNQRNIEAVAGPDEAGGIIRSVAINGRSKKERVVGHDSYGSSTHTGKTCDHVASKPRLDLKELPVIHDQRD